MENDIKFLLEDIAKSIKEMDVRLRTIELDLQKTKIYNSFIECNYSTLVNIIENFNNNKQIKKEILNNTLKNVFLGSNFFRRWGIFFRFNIFFNKNNKIKRDIL